MLSRKNLLAIQLLTLELKFDVFIHELERRYMPDQPRVPAGSSDGGQWTVMERAMRNRRLATSGPKRVMADLTTIGTLKRKVSAPGIGLVLCIYDFGDSLYTLSSDQVLGCMGVLHQSAVVPIAGGRGSLLNDY